MYGTQMTLTFMRLRSGFLMLKKHRLLVGVLVPIFGLGISYADCDATQITRNSEVRQNFEIQIPNNSSTVIFPESLIVEIKGVKLPKSITGLRIFIGPRDGSTPNLESDYYVGSVSKGQVSAEISSENFAVDIGPSLKRLQSDGKMDMSKKQTIQLSIEAIPAPGLTNSDVTKIERVEVQSDK